jgi:hypothetical protein
VAAGDKLEIMSVSMGAQVEEEGSNVAECKPDVWYVDVM